MRAIRAIAVNTFREAIRDRILYLFIGFAIVMVISTKLFGMLTVGDESKIVKDIGLAAMQFFSMLIAVMMSMLLISREVDDRTVFNILSKPVRRWQFILGKYLGLVAIVAANLLLITVILIADEAIARHLHPRGDHGGVLPGSEPGAFQFSDRGRT
jgi:ABC-type transport system involved in multi-copper enzyme maturation permease subunit